MFQRLTCLFLFVFFLNSGFAQVAGITSSNLPLVVINTNGQGIPYDYKITCGMKVIYNGAGQENKPTDSGNIYSGFIGIEIHGTYSASLPQKPYGIETRDAANNNRNVSLLGMPEENDWLLIANYNDKTFMRNSLAFELFRRMGHYAPRTWLVEVIVNNEYQGIYLLTEKIKQDKGRVDIAKLATKDITGDDLTGGYIFKIDYYDSSNSWQSNYTATDHPEKQVYYVYADPNAGSLVYQQKNYLKSFVNSFESVLNSAGFTDKTTGYPAWIDANSFIDYFIVNEVARNVDAFKKSCYFFKDKDSKGGKIHAGPVWDFDWAWKNIWDCSTFSATDGSGWSYLINNCPDIYPNSNGWMVRFLQDPDFANALNKRYFELRNSYLSTDYLQSYIDSVENLVQEAQVRHYAKWNILSSNVGAPEVDAQPSTYSGQVDQFSNWIKTRLIWLDGHMVGYSDATFANKFQPQLSYRVFPNPASDIVYLEAADEIQDIEFYQSNGICVMHRTGISAFSTKLNISALSPGIYLVRIGVKNAPAINSKLVIQ